MEYLTVIIGRQTFYIDKTKIVGIIQHPVIYRIPDGDENIEGLSLYNGKLVAYIRLGDICSHRCGIVLNTGNKILYGVAVENIGEEEKIPGELSAIITGVWGRNSD